MSFLETVSALYPTSVGVPDAAKLNLPIHQREYLCDGEIRTWEGRCTDVFSPVCFRESSGLKPVLLGSHPELSPRESLAALEAACRAYDHGRGKWPTMSVGERIRHLEQFAWRMKERREEVVRLLMWEIGKARKDSEKEFDRTIDYIIGTIDALKDVDRTSSRFVIEEDVIAQIRRAPLGVVLCMGPYNYPLNETFTTLIPALIMGNTVILKPARFGVLLLGPLLAAFKESFPPGVVNTLYGDGATVIEPLMRSGKIDCLAFIGSSKVADILKQQHPQPHRLRSVLGLGAKNPAIILADADLDTAIAEGVAGGLSFNGQRCTALKIFFVHESIAGIFVERFVSAVEALRPGMPWEDGVKITPLPEPNKPSYLTKVVGEAKQKGAEVLNAHGGETLATYFHPAVVYPVREGMELYAHEQFGPVVPIAVFRDIDEPIRYIVESPYGQQVSLFGTDEKQLAKLIDPLANQVCRLNINSQCQRGPDKFPFTGRKDSAEGTLSISDALRVFSIRTLVAARGTEGNKRILSEIVRERRSSFLSTDFIF